MGKKLAFWGDCNGYGYKIIRILEELGGINGSNYAGNEVILLYHIDKKNNIKGTHNGNLDKEKYVVMTYQDFISKYPFQVGDIVYTTDNHEEGKVVEIVWDETKKKFAFHADGECEFTQEKINGEINSALMFRLQQHEQLYQILKKLNDIPNAPTPDCEEYIDGIIEVNFPIPLDENINFTFYDTPGTDSNSNEHLLVLQKALHQLQ